MPDMPDIPDAADTPRYIVSDACISFTEALISYRGSVIDLDDANAAGRDLFAWFQDQNASTLAAAPLAKRSVVLGILAIQKNGTETVDEAVDLIKETYQHYSA
jgi:hypothetical protein